MTRIASQSTSNSATANTTTATYPAKPTTGNTLIAVVYSPAAVGNNAIAGWEKISDQRSGGNTDGSLTVFRKIAGTNEASAVQATTSSPAFIRLLIHEYSGLDPSAAVTVLGTNTSGTPAGASGTTVNTLAASSTGAVSVPAGATAFAAWGFSGGVGQSVDSGFTQILAGSRAYTADLTPSSAASVNPAITTSTTTRIGAILVSLAASPTGPPQNVSAPAITGTAGVGQVQTCAPGTWNQAIPSGGFAYQWGNSSDGTTWSDIVGATTATYTVASSDAGKKLRCLVTATNSQGQTGTAYSGPVSIPAPPVATSAPVIRVQGGGTAATGKTLEEQTPAAYDNAGAGTGFILTFQWYRGNTPLTGATDPTAYPIVQSDENGTLYLHEIPKNNGGDGAHAISNGITVPATAPLSDASFLVLLSGGTGNTSGAASIGGARGGTYDGQISSLFGPIPGSVAQAGGFLYRDVYIRNLHASTTAAALKLFIEQQFTAPGLELAVAVPAEGPNTVLPVLASGTTEPAGATWVTTTDPAAGPAFGDLASGAYRGVHVRLKVTAGTPAIDTANAQFAAGNS